MARIFISYRREDAAGHAGRLADVLQERWGADTVFRDVDAIAPGDDFVTTIRDAIASCDAVLVVIGRDWLNARDAEGGRRLDDDTDHVRSEVAAALAREVRTIPLLVEGARMPDEQDLPPDIAALSRRNALALGEASWNADVDRLLTALQDVLPPPAAARAPSGSRERRRPPGLIAAAAGVLLLLVVAIAWPRDRAADPAGPDDVLEPPAETAASLGVAERVLESRPLELPQNFAFELAQAVFDLRDAHVERTASGTALVLGFRFTNHASVDDNFQDGSFSLDLDGETTRPVSDLNLLVGAHSTADGVVRFPLPESAIAATLRIIHHADVTTVGIDLRPGRRAAEGVPGPAVVAIQPAGPTRFELEDMVIDVADISVRRYVNKDVLTAKLTVTHREGPPDLITDANVRLAFDEQILAPVSSLSLLLPSDATGQGAVDFELDPGVRAAGLRLSFGAQSAELALDLSAAAR